ncbi:MAG: 50S ribosomal protein L11 methyltransferase [Pseudomonadales bacterium]|nr:50S ribosomal protein L11 methyltransferase [Gammaproteobacteria bacterium]NNL56838.1 50S ribosomal protein L11 methyltransferase [Pseudomonadales bacterium]
MSWLQLHINVTPAQVEQLEQALQSCGALSITFQDLADQPIFEPGVGETPLWPSMRASALFDANVVRQSITDALHSEFASPLPAYEFEIVEDRDWQREWLDQFEPLCCGSRLWICPGWQQPPDSNAVNLMLDPGLAFGTGTHETTWQCLQWLDASDLAGKRVLDFGCGSGILAIAAMLLGASHATLVDNDPQALTASAANLAKNGIDQNACTLRHANDFAQQQSEQNALQFDVVLANILARPLIELAGSLVAAMRPGAELVMSGIREQQQQAVEAAYHPQIQFAKAGSLNGWLRLAGVKTEH